MSKRDISFLLEDILESINNIETYVSGFDKKTIEKQLMPW